MRKIIISVAVSAAYLITTIFPYGLKASDIVLFFSESSFAENKLEYGKILETNTPQGEKPDIFFIHELHCNPGAQQNIFKIICMLDRGFKLNAVFTEGAPSGKVNLSAIRDIHPSAVRDGILKRMISEGLLSGCESYCAVNDKTLYGLEDWDLYRQNVERFRQIKKTARIFLNCILSAKNDLDIEKIKFYSPENYLYDSLYCTASYKNKEYYDKIKKLADFCGINMDKYPQIKYAAFITESQEMLKNKNISKDSSYFLSLLKRNVSFGQYKSILEENSFKTPDEAAVFLYEKSSSFMTPAETEKYDYFKMLCIRNRFLKRLDIKGFIFEEKTLKKELFSVLFKDGEKRKISELYLKLAMLEDYVDMSMPFDEWKELKNGASDFKTLLKNSSVSNKKSICEILDSRILKDYYSANEYRNRIFWEKIKERFVKGETYVLTAGGFHNDVIKFFEEAGLKYVVILPDASGETNFWHDKILIDSAAMKDALSEGLLVSGVSEYKKKMFLISFIEELRAKGFSDDSIKEVLNRWYNQHNDCAILKFKDTYNLSELVEITNKSSIKGRLLHIKKELIEYLANFRQPFVYKYDENGVKDGDLQILKKMQSNVRFFPFIELMLGFNIYSSFSTLFMQANGYTLGFISVIFSVLAPVSFISSGLCGFIGDKISKRTLIIISLVLHTVGSVLFMFSGLSPVILAVSQILPVIAISGLGVSMSPFLMSSLEKLNDKDSFKKLYGANTALFWIIMSVSSLLGGVLLLITDQVTIVAIAALVDVACLIGAFIFTHKEKTAKENKAAGADKKLKTVFKEKISGIFVPLSVLFSDKNTFSLVAVNIAVNNIFFVILCFFLQPSLADSGLNAAFLAPVYFAANLLQSVGSNTGDRLKNIVMRHTNRTFLFGAGFGLVTLFFITGSPLFLIGLYLLMNFWQAVSTVTEVSAVYNIIGDSMRSKWLAFKAMAGTIVASLTQLFITALVSSGVDGTVLTGGATVVLTAFSFILPMVLNSGSEKIFFRNNDMDFSNVRMILSSS